jgi:hypothetical protein
MLVQALPVLCFLPLAGSGPWEGVPRSVLNRIRFNSDYAEDGVKPENLTMACLGGAC